MKKYFVYLLASLSFCTAKASTAPFRSSAKLKDLVNEEFVKYKQEASVLKTSIANLVFISGKISHVQHGDDNIYISLDEISPYLQNQSDDFTRLFIDFVIGHEMGHIYHYHAYQPEVIRRGKGEGVVFLECFADLYAGFLLTQVDNTINLPALIAQNPNLDLSAYHNSRAPAMFAVYETITQMDNANQTITTHPAPEQRMMALKSGIMMGNYVFNDYLLLHNTAGSLNMSEEIYTADKEFIDQLGLSLGFKLDDFRNNYMQWLHEEAIRIINENNSLARNLIRYHTLFDNQHIRHKPVVNYSFKVWNENTTAVRFAGRVITVQFPDNLPTDVVKSAPIDGNPFDITIPAGQSATIQGTLSRVTANGFLSKLVLPGDRNSLYFVFDAQNPKPDNAYQETSNYDFSNWSEESLESINDLLNDIVNKSKNLLSYTKGIGISRDSTYAGLISGKRYYEPIFKTAGTDDQKIYYREKSSEIAYTFTAFTSPNNAQSKQHFNEIIQRVKASFAQLKQQPIEHYPTSDKEEFWDENDNVIISITLKNYGNNSIALVVYGNSN